MIEAGGVIDVDYTGAQILCDAITVLRQTGIEVAIARLSDPRAQSAAKRTGLLAAVGDDRVFKPVNEALEAFGADSNSRESGAGARDGARSKS